MRERTPFGERLHLARTHAKMTQDQLAKAAKIAQGTLGELEWRGDGSMAVVRLAVACGVRPEWLADDEGEMVDRAIWPFQHISKAEILALDQADLSLVEGAIINALSRIEPPPAPPTPKDLQNFHSAHGGVRPKSRKRKAE